MLGRESCAFPFSAVALACWKDVWSLELEPLASISSLLFLGNALRTIIETIPQLKEKLKPDQSFRLHRLHLMQEQSCLEVSTCKQFPCLKGRGLATAS